MQEEIKEPILPVKLPKVSELIKAQSVFIAKDNEDHNTDLIQKPIQEDVCYFKTKNNCFKKYIFSF